MFILLNVTGNGTVSLVQFSDCSLLAYKNKIDFCIFMLLITSLNLFNISNNFWKDSLGSSIHMSMLSENPNSITFSFSSLIALASIYSIVLNRSGRTNILVLFLILRGKPLNLSPLSVMLTVGFS